VTTVAQGVLEWKQNQKTQSIGLDVQAWLDRFYMSRIGIRFLIGQRRYITTLHPYTVSHTPDVDVALNTLGPHPDYVGIICTRAVSDLPHNFRDVILENFHRGPTLTHARLFSERTRYCPRGYRERPFRLRRALWDVQRPARAVDLPERPALCVRAGTPVAHLL